jgi:hypothetical protein
MSKLGEIKNLDFITCAKVLGGNSAFLELIYNHNKTRVKFAI